MLEGGETSGIVATKEPIYPPVDQIRDGKFLYDNPSSPDYLKPGDSVGMLRAITTKYFSVQPEQAQLVSDRYARLKERDPALATQEPRATIAIPIALHDEQIDTLRDTLTVVASQKGIEQDEIFLYGNVPSDLGEREKREAQAKLDKLLAEFKDSNPQMKLRSIVEEYEPDRLTMGQVRHDYMDLIALDAQHRGFRIDHPVIMLDADIKRMGKDASEKLAATLTAADSNKIVAHLETAYLFDKEEGTLSDVRKLAIIQETRRRQFIRMFRKFPSIPNTPYEAGKKTAGYTEELGSAVALGAYLLVGGYDENTPISENHMLLYFLEKGEKLIDQVIRYAKPEVSEAIDIEPYLLMGVSVSSSARGQEEDIQRLVEERNPFKLKHRLEAVGDFITMGRRYSRLLHTETKRSGRAIQSPLRPLQDDARGRKIVAAALGPEFVKYTPDPDTQEPVHVQMPDPRPLLKRYGLPVPRESRLKQFIKTAKGEK